MKHDPLHLATLIGSRICHDLVSPIGAIKNGLELLHLSSEKSNGPEICPIEKSTDNAIGRVNFSYNTELWNSLLQPSHRHDIAPAKVNFLLLPLICQQMEKPINLDKSADNTAFYITF